MKETRTARERLLKLGRSARFETIWKDPAIRSAAFSFGLSRAAILIVFVLTTHLTIPTPPQTVGDYKNPNIVLNKQTIRPKLAELAYYGDGGWYIGIVRNGYEKIPFDANGQHNWAFFPLYPLLLRAAFGITGGVVLTGMVLSSFLLFLALIFLYKAAIVFGWNDAIADRSVFYLAFFPVSYFFSLPMTESLFLLLAITSILAGKRDLWWLAGILGAMASATRAMGIILLPVLLVLYWQQRGRRIRPDVIGLLLIPLGLLAFMYYLHAITGEPLAFSRVLGSWGRKSGFFLLPLWEFLKHPREVSISWDFRLLNFAASVVALVCGLVLAKRRHWALALYTLAGIIIPLSSQLLQSHARYVLVLFPVFIILAEWGCNSRVDQTIRAAFLVLFGIMSTLFAAHFSIAMS